MQRPKVNPPKGCVWNWFLSLDVAERSAVLSIEDKEAVQLIQKMFQKKVDEGEGLFFAVDDGFEDMELELPRCPNVKKSNYIFSNKNDFCFIKMGCLDQYRIINYPESLIRSDCELENAVRLCDTREYLDTMTVATHLLEDPINFLRLMERASRGSFLTSPCKVDYVPKISQWVWKEPLWFEGMGFYSLGTFICHKLEQELWKHYWEHKRLDPRATYGRRRFTFPTSSRQALLSKTHLTEFWMNTEPLVRLQIIGGLGSIVDSALRDSTVEHTKVEKPVLCPVLSSSSLGKKVYRKGVDLFSLHKGFPLKEIRLLSALVDFSMAKRAVAFLFVQPNNSNVNHRSFIEFLYFSPLKTAGTPINYVLRRLGFIIQNAYTEKLSLDLILGEKKTKTKRMHKGNKRKKGNNKKKLLKRRLTIQSTVKPKATKPKMTLPVKPKPVKPSVPVTPPKHVGKIVKTSSVSSNAPTRSKSAPSPKKETRKDFSSKQLPEPCENRRKCKNIKNPLLSPLLDYEKPKQSQIPAPIAIPPPMDDTWLEVVPKGRSKKKKIQKSAPTSPRKKTGKPSKPGRIRRSKSGSVRPIPHIALHVTPPPPLIPKKYLKNNRSLSSPSLRPSIEEKTDENPNIVVSELPRSRVPISCNQPKKNISPLLNHTDNVGMARTRSSSCSPQRKPPSSPRRSHSASARSRTPPLKKGEGKQTNPTSETSPNTKKRVLIDKGSGPTQRRSRIRRGAKYKPKRHVLHTHEQEHENANPLSAEITNYVTFLKEVVRNHHLYLVEKIVQRIRCSVGSLWPSAIIKIYGSIATGMCIPESDLDIVVSIPDAPGVSPILMLAAELKGKVWVKQIKPIYSAAVPVIKLMVDGLPVDITFDVRTQTKAITYAQTDLDHSVAATSSHTGLKTSQLILELKKEYPALEPLVLILKQYLYCVLLNSSYTGGLASYSLVLMVASYLKRYGHGKSLVDLGTLLLGFFELYGKLFDYTRTGISLTEPEGFFARDADYFDHGPAQLIVVDPMCPTNNIASGTYALYRVKQAFANGYNTLSERFSSPFMPTFLSRLLPIMLSNGFMINPQ